MTTTKTIQDKLNAQADAELRAELDAASSAFIDVLKPHQSSYIDFKDKDDEVVIQRPIYEFIKVICDKVFDIRQNTAREIAAQEFINQVETLAAEVDDIQNFLNS